MKRRIFSSAALVAAQVFAGPGNKKVVWVQGSEHGYVPPAYEGRDVVREVK